MSFYFEKMFRELNTVNWYFRNSKITEASLSTAPENFVAVTVRREAGEGELSKIKFVVDYEGGEFVKEVEISLEELESESFLFSDNNFETASKITIYPILIKDGEDKVYLKGVSEKNLVACSLEFGGWDSWNGGTILHSYYAGAATNTADGTNSYGTSTTKTELEVKSHNVYSSYDVYSSWDFDNIWQENVGSYPTLRTN